MASYEVEEILDSRKKGKNTEFLIRWAPTWVAERNLSCAQLIKQFKAKNKDNANEENGHQNEDEEEEEEQVNVSKRGRPRKAAKVANKKRKASQKSCKKSKRRR